MSNSSTLVQHYLTKNTYRMNDTVTDISSGYGMLYRLLQCFGIIKFNRKNKCRLTCILYLIIPVFLHLAFAEFLISTFVGMDKDWFDWKVDTAYVICFALGLGTWHITRRESKRVLGVIRKIQYLSRPTKPQKMNIIVITIIAVLFTYPVLGTWLVYIYDDQLELNVNIVLYGAKFKETSMIYACFVVRGVFHDCVPQMANTLILLLYLVLCHETSIVVRDFTKEVDAIPVDAFIAYQSWFLKKHLAIIDVIQSLQTAFSITSFGLCSYYTLMNFCKLSGFLLLGRAVVDSNGPLIFDYVYWIVYMTTSLFALFFVP